MKCPLPLAAIAIRRDLMEAHGSDIDRALRASVEYAFAHPDASREYVSTHAREMDPAVAAKHIQLYVNDYTVALDERAVHALLDFAQQQGSQRNGLVRTRLYLIAQFRLKPDTTYSNIVVFSTRTRWAHALTTM